MIYIILKKVLCLLFISIVFGSLAMGQQVDNRRAKNNNQYDKIIYNASIKHKIHPCIVKAVIWRESRFNKYAIGKAGEVGVMQVTRSAVMDWSREKDVPCPSRKQLFNPRLNIEIGTWYLARAEKFWRKYPESYVLALCEYNAGRKGMLEMIRIQGKQGVRISNLKLYNYASSIIKQYYYYLNGYKKSKSLKKLAYEYN